MKECFLFKQPKATMVLLHVLNHAESATLTAKFLESYRRFGPGEDHETIVVFNNGNPTQADLDMFLNVVPRVSFVQHDNSGWDIGAFIRASHFVNTPMAVYFGNTSYVQREGWLSRMLQSWEKHGRGFYGSLSTFEVSPHLNTSGFWCAPEMMPRYPIRIVSKPDRYGFEHGKLAMWRMVASEGFPARLVTWDDDYLWPQWRLAGNIYRRGDQSNCLTYFRHSTNFAVADPGTRAYMAKLADTLTDWEFISMLNHQ